MFIMHIAIQGCLRAHDVEYGITADTGGHIRYLLELAQASARDHDVERIDIVTRAFDADFSEGDYRQACEYLNPKVRIVRLPTPDPGYRAKEELWDQLPAFSDALVDYIDGLERAPDVLHAHYADAAEVAASVKARRGLPFVFTAHSLGMAKARYGRATPDSEADRADLPAALARRIGFENTALGEAGLIVASSRDEAELQYADYPDYRPGAIRVIRPASDLQVFAQAQSTAQVQQMLARFLSDPDKPALLAIARPVTRKNLASLIRAYGESPALQARANLVILAGGRQSLDTLEPEIADNLREMLQLIDHYDLYGRVAYPKQHRMADVPAVYAWARERGGLFANVAFNEPFGLTLLEAAAAGLPVIATDSGGPNDIIEQCHNGLLVNPCCTDAIAHAALTLLDDPARWAQCQSSGRAAIGLFDWQRHVAYYHRLLARLLGRAPAGRRDHAGRRCGLDTAGVLLLCDIDGTLVGCPRGVDAFNSWLPGQTHMAFGVATGRSFHSALLILEQAGIDWPDVLISSVGAEIHCLAADGVTYERDQAWQRHIDHDWSRAAIVDALAGVPELVPQAALEQRVHKISYLCAPGIDIADRLRGLLADRGLAATVIHSHDRCVDILPARASKGTAVAWLAKREDIAIGQVYVAGDSGNDRDMLAASPCAIVVANHRDELATGPGLEHAYFARTSHARGVIEGVAHFRAQSNVS
ncbi:HAD-IIB family hydrolase [Salinisphaera aquimarina]|uniref:sucrose-phosphate synthase n=1 Tax=Salinisphaera aquimarina TaxID=2094031 RepID=A0ABV7EMC9_9GAMM